MQIQKLPLSKTNILRDLIADYLSGKEKLKGFYSFAPIPEAIEKAISERKKIKTDRKTLQKLLMEDYTRAFGSEENIPGKIRENISLLEDPDTFTITTGHQLNIFGGPLFYIYKIISTIKIAEELKKKYPAFNFVPVYWMGSEDHDFAEINHIHLFGKKIEWNVDHGGAVGEINPSTLLPLLEEIRENLREKETFDSIIGNHWQEAFKLPTLALATLNWVSKIFAGDGLVVLDPDKGEFKRNFSGIIREDLNTNIHHELVEATKDKLKEYDLPVNPREINLFFMEEGKRNRIVSEGKNFRIHGTGKEFSHEELMELLEKEPEKFSPNVVLRPLYQETILPNLAYVGGTNEIAYWFELKQLFEHHGTFFPQLMIRNSAMWIGGGAVKKMEKYEIEPEDLFISREDFIRSYLAGKEETIPLENRLQKLKEDYGALMEECRNYSNDLKWEVINSAKAHIKDLEKIRSNVKKILKERNEKDINGITKVYETLFPEGALQERHENMIPYLLIRGNEWLDIMKREFNPYRQEVVIFKG